ncbi:autotransporter outer membrane beta-barrel domain-containing protein, partial [Stenotrophomonas maltophilia]|nr:autotransporter outer membrane beta-barrel domain-containing protein [Stenotrophomonas maltophilia]
MRMMQFTPKFPSTFVRSRLALALAGLILVPSMEAAAVDLNNGASATVVPGHVWVGQDFTLRSNSHLTVDGTRVGRVNSQDSTVTLSNASAGLVSLMDSVGDIRGSTLAGLNTSAFLSNPTSARTVIAISNSRVESPFTASRISGGGTIRASSTAFAGDVHGVLMLAGILELRSGSSVVGAQDGIDSRLNAGGQPAMGPDGWYVLVDGSSVEGTAGAALSANTQGSAPQVNRFIVQNGATLKGGNGNLLQANAAALFDFTGRTSTLAGNFTIADTATGTLRFLDGLDLTGRILGPADVIVDQGGRWTLSGDSNTGNLTLGAGSDILLGPGEFRQLTVNGNYVGQGGTLHFNTVMAADDAPTSKVHVTGDASGSTRIVVNNINGAGAQTINGIPLVQVDGTSTATFAMQGRAIGGMYEYFLRKGTPGATNGNWYLTSAYTGNPCDINPS